tara:strand:- start:1772 stop:2233 length:462 start_codon:yes stop_codon:yes gene_type:complete
MNKKIFTLPFLVPLFLFNSGFIFKPKLRAFSCGDYIHLAKSNQELLKIQEEILIFDPKGNSYQYDYFSNKVSPEKLKVIEGVNLNLKKSYLEGSNFYLDYNVIINSVPATMQIILDYDKKTFNSSYTIYGSTQYMQQLNCKEIKFPKDTKFEY